MSQVGKLNMVNAKLGATRPGQQTTRTIFDTATTAVAGQTRYSFFKNFAGKTEFETNLTTNKLDSSESMVIKSIFMETSDTAGLSGMSKINIKVGNQVVLKDYNIAYNAGNRGTNFARIQSGASSPYSVEVRLLTDIVIPPQTNFEVEFEGSFTPATTLDSKFQMHLKGYGVIFSAGSSF